MDSSLQQPCLGKLWSSVCIKVYMLHTEGEQCSSSSSALISGASANKLALMWRPSCSSSKNSHFELFSNVWSSCSPVKPGDGKERYNRMFKKEKHLYSLFFLVVNINFPSLLQTGSPSILSPASSPLQSWCTCPQAQSWMDGSSH